MKNGRKQHQYNASLNPKRKTPEHSFKNAVF
jgi:hypothetical protein